MRLTVETEQEEDGRWIAEVSELPGVMRYGRSRAEAIAQAEALALLHWELAFPIVWPDGWGSETGGFDAVIGNPPWDRIKLQEVEWFAERRLEIAKAAGLRP